jgi:glycosyltransferase involved in cell wall biosynthesis
MKKKLTFFTFGEDAFLRDLIVGLRKDYNIKFFQKGTETEFFQMYHDCDIAWFEWCDQLIFNAMQHPKMGKKIVCRLHSYELFTDLPGQVDWNKVDKLMFVSDTVRNLTCQKFGLNPYITEVISNGVDVDKFAIPKDKKYNKKIVFLGFINYKKGIETLLHAFEHIYRHDPSFTFHIAGEHQDERIALYMDHAMHSLPFKIQFDGWVKDVPTYLQDKDYVISTSLFESFQYSVAEGMAQGLIPLVYNWRGSKDIYPNDYVFDTLDQCVNIVKRFDGNDNKDAIRQSMRKHIVDNFSLEKQLMRTRELLGNL